jgi:hypothetical protein
VGNEGIGGWNESVAVSMDWNLERPTIQQNQWL